MRRVWPIVLLLVSAACSDGLDGRTSTPPGAPASLVTVPEVSPVASREAASTAPTMVPSDPSSGATLVVADASGQVGVVDGAGRASPVRADGWLRRLSLDGSYVVSTALVGPGDTKVAWDALPSTEVLGGTVFVGEDLEPAATQVGGHLTAFVNRALPVADGSIAGGRTSSTVVLASPDAGAVGRYELDGNVVPEAFGSTRRADGVPAMVFMLEFLPAEAPTRYRVRVLDTATGALTLPANLRDKLGPRIDQEMAGVTRGQVLSADHGLLFTLYRGTSDMPHGHPYAFVHTLDLFDGVWCLDIPPELELERLPGALAVSGDRLYVASANGMVGAYDIDAVVSPDGPVTMQWVTRVLPASGMPGDAAPAIAADPQGAVVAWPSMSGFHHVDPDGTVGRSTIGPAGTEALAVVDGEPLAIGDTWWGLPSERPTWLADVTRLQVVPDTT